jgi:hypothetical protein
MYSSSLPSFLTDFHGTATILECLDFQCREDDGGPDLNTSVTLTDHEQFTCPQLTTLYIDGRNYYEACRRDAHWTDTIATIKSLSISYFNPQPGESFTTYDFLRPLTVLATPRSLHFADLVLHPSPGHLQLAQLLPDVYFLTFEDLHDFQVIDEIITVVGSPFDLTLTRCTIGTVTGEFIEEGFGDSGGLYLRDINDDLVPLLRLWNGQNLHIDNCPCFDDNVLDMMSSEEQGNFICAPFAEALHIRDCPNFTFSALRRFVQSRLSFNLPDFDDPPDHPPISFPYLHITGSAPSLSEQDREWFVANVSVFFCV